MPKQKSISPEDALKAFQEWDTEAQVQHLYKVRDVLAEKQAALKEKTLNANAELSTIEKAIQQ